jgi:hypothetical protein
MGTTSSVGTSDPATGRWTLRPVLYDGAPSTTLPSLQRIWATTCSRDTTAFIDAVLGHDWTSLDPDTQSRTTPDPGSTLLIAGVGTAINPAAVLNATGDPGQDGPISIAPAVGRVLLDGEYVYLISSHDDTIHVVSLRDPWADPQVHPFDAHHHP